MALAAVAGLTISVDSTAASVTLSGVASNSCTYNGSVQVNPDGGLTIACTGGGPVTPGSPGNFSLVSAALNANPNTTVGVGVTRTVGTTGATTLPYTLGGAGCLSAAGAPVSVADGASSATINVPVGASGACTVTLGTPSLAGATVSGSSTVITVVAAAPPPATGVGCPTGYTQPANMLTAALGGFGNPLYQMQASGQIVSIPLPVTGLNSGSVAFGESAGGAYTPQPVTIEVSVNKCPGLIEPVNNAAGQPQYCNLRNTNGNYNSITWIAKPLEGVIQDINTANIYLGACWAGDVGATYYINARWTYGSCAFGAQICGFGIQHNRGGY